MTRRKQRSSPEGRTFDRLERVVTALVKAGLNERDAAPPNLVERLSHLEQAVRASGGDRQVLQVIASGRRLLGTEQRPGSPPEARRLDADDTPP